MAIVFRSVLIGAGGGCADGATALPINDVQIWLSCVGLSEPYTTISEVLADTTTLGLLIESDNACDYLVRSTSWISAVCANETAMVDIGSSEYCSDLLLSNSAWNSAILNSAYNNYVYTVMVPVMTSYTAPAGQVYTNSVYGSFDGYRAFRNQAYTNDGWAANGNNAYLTYDFGRSVKIYKVRVYNNRASGFNFTLTSFSISGSNDNSTFTTLIATRSYNNAENLVLDIPTPDLYRYYKLTGVGVGAYVSVQWLQYYGR